MALAASPLKCRDAETMKKTIITGITGQNGPYLAECPLKLGCEVHDIKRCLAFSTDRIDNLYEDPHASQRHFICTTMT